MIFNKTYLYNIDFYQSVGRREITRWILVRFSLNVPKFTPNALLTGTVRFRSEYIVASNLSWWITQAQVSSGVQAIYMLPKFKVVFQLSGTDRQTTSSIFNCRGTLNLSKGKKNTDWKSKDRAVGPSRSFDSYVILFVRKVRSLSQKSNHIVVKDDVLNIHILWRIRADRSKSQVSRTSDHRWDARATI